MMSSLLSSIYSSALSLCHEPIVGRHHQPLESSSSVNVNVNVNVDVNVVNLSTRDREELANEIDAEINCEEMRASITELESTLGRCRASLEAFEKKERFVGVRLARYRSLMERREERMQDMMDRLNNNMHDNDRSRSDDSEEPFLDEDGGGGGENLDLENNNNNNFDSLRDQLDALRSKHGADQAALQNVEDLHKDIVAQTEIFRRRVKDLEEKQRDLLSKRDECQDFLIAASAVYA